MGKTPIVLWVDDVQASTWCLSSIGHWPSWIGQKVYTIVNEVAARTKRLSGHVLKDTKNIVANGEIPLIIYKWLETISKYLP